MCKGPLFSENESIRHYAFSLIATTTALVLPSVLYSVLYIRHFEHQFLGRFYTYIISTGKSHNVMAWGYVHKLVTIWSPRDDGIRLLDRNKGC
jgi:hypothetical protein